MFLKFYKQTVTKINKMQKKCTPHALIVPFVIFHPVKALVALTFPPKSPFPAREQDGKRIKSLSLLSLISHKTS